MVNNFFVKLEKILGRGRILENEILAKHCTWRIGGPARYWFDAKTKEDLVQAVKIAREEQVPYFVLGGGSNILFSDKGFDGLMIKNSTSMIRNIGVVGRMRREIQNIEVLVEAESGVGFNRLVRFTLDEGLSGLEAFLGQPGTVGGALYINAHSLKEKKFAGDLLVKAKIFDKEGEILEADKDYFHFGYDESKIQKTKDIVLSVVFRLARKSREEVWDKANKCLEYRQLSQPQGYASAGCTFRNISEAEALSANTPNHSQSAGFLIDQCGLKGYQIGAAQISDKHANFIINKGEACARDVLALIELCRSKVKEKFGVELKEEVVMVGF